MRSHQKYSVIALVLLITSVVSITIPVLGVKTIRIDPYSPGYPGPIMLESPATFKINVTNDNQPAWNPQILLVISQGCYDGMAAADAQVIVSWDGSSISFAKSDFGTAGKWVPDATSKLYEDSSLKSHLGVSNSETIYFAHGPFLAATITEEEQEFTVELFSSDPRMLVYAYGSTKDGGDIDNSVPNSQPGFVVPEIPGTLIGVVTMMAALLMFARGQSIKKLY